MANSGDSSSAAAKDQKILSEVMNRVEHSYVEPVQSRTLMDNALKGMLTGLDPHSNYLTPAEYARMKSDMAAKFGGLGMEVLQENGVPTVLSPIDDTPAARAGIEPGDLIVAIDGAPTAGMALQSVVSRLRGPIGTKVTLAIARDDRPPFDVTLTRALIHVRSVKSALEADKIGYVRISTFVDNTQRELTKAIAALRREAGGRLNGFILDLRDDPGGELDQAVDVAGDFLDGGTIVTTRGRNASDIHRYAAPDGGDRLKGVPMVVLIDGASASASEIVAGALQDDHRAELMGTPSFGKGSVQSVVPLDGGGALLLTTALYFTPAGRSIQGVGLQPDVVVPLPKDEEVANRVMREADFYDALKNAGTLRKGAATAPKAAASPIAASSERPIKLALIATPHDAQLAAAVDYLEASTAKAGGPPHG